MADLMPEFLEGSQADYIAIIDGTNEQPLISLAEFQLESLIYVLHCLDICILKERGKEYRGEFMNAATEFACEVFGDSQPETFKAKFRMGFADLYNARQSAYSKYVLPAKNGPLKGTLFWEYSKHICFAIGVVNPLSITRVATLATGCFGKVAKVSKAL